MESRKKIYLSDYKAPAYVITDAYLIFDIFDQFVEVTSHLTIQKKNIEENKIVLHGEKLELIDVQLNNEKCVYHVSDKRLEIQTNLTEFTLQIKNKINPYQNKTLEGLYLSGTILCTQNEPEGFRKMTYFLDQSDNLTIFKTKIIADKKRFPYLLCNGDCIEKGELEQGRHFQTYFDPFPKPSYLFALVAGDLAVTKDTFITKSNRKIHLEIYVDHGNEDKTAYAMESLKKSMKWDEDIFNLEYDLNTYMIVAVDSFNFGAMENKGLNIFNSLYVLARLDTATDHNFQSIEGVIGHEYFHNWTGNRVTLRDWFQLTLKEGLTVYRDQEFSADMQSRKVKRIHDVMTLKERQFPEDAGPLSHPIKPKSYLEINNFYTATVYEKGAEVIRMIETIIGKEKFIKGVNDYLETHDGKAATTEDFIHSMEKVSGKNFDQFKYWYDQSGTPHLYLKLFKENNNWVVEYRQEARLNNPSAECLEIPIKMAFFNNKGKKVIDEKVYLFNKIQDKIIIQTEETFLVPSLNRNFTSPVHIHYDYQYEDELLLFAFDDDGYSRYEMAQILMKKMIMNIYQGQNHLDDRFIAGVKQILKSITDDPYYLSLVLTPPSEAQLNLLLPKDDYSNIKNALKKFMSQLALHCKHEFTELLKTINSDVASLTLLSSQAMGQRSLKNVLYSYLCYLTDENIENEMVNLYQSAQTMTDSLTALEYLYEMESQKVSQLMDDFYKKFEADKLVILKWFRLKVKYTTNPQKDLISLMQTKAYDEFNPNIVRSVWQNFMLENLVYYHHPSGTGYRMVADEIIKIDRFNPQLASRLAKQMGQLSRLTDQLRDLLKQEMERLIKIELSNDTYEVIKANLNG